jgi:RHS repeat-associated protein
MLRALFNRLHDFDNLSPSSHTAHTPYSPRVRYALLLASAWCLLTGAAPALAQNVQHTSKSVDLGLRSDLKVNPTTHGFELTIPLRSYPGRAGSGLPVGLHYSSKVWRVAYGGHVAVPGFTPFTVVNARFAQHSSAGWTSSLGVPSVDNGPQSENYNNSGAPISSCTFGGDDGAGGSCCFVDRLLIRMPDGSSHEVRSRDEPFCYTGSTAPALPDDLYATDGSRLRYQRSTGTLFLPDGSRYILGSGTVQYVDRNGNTMTYADGQWTDTLGRVINIPLGHSGTGDFTYTLPGVGGTPANYIFRWRNLSDVRTDPSQPLRNLGDSSCAPGDFNTYGPSLFTSAGDTKVCGNAAFNPVVLHQIELPNGRAYTFTYNVYAEIDKVVYPTGGYERFRYGWADAASWSTGVYAQGNRGVVDRWVSAKGDGSDEAQNHWQYTSSNSVDRFGPGEVTPDGTYTERLIHREDGGNWGYSYSGAAAGMPYEERVFSAPDAGGNRRMLRRRLTKWEATGSNAVRDTAQHATRNARVTKEVEIILDMEGDALAKTTVYGYDLTYQFNTGINRTTVSEYDFVAVPRSTAQTASVDSIPMPAQPLRITETAYLDAVNASYRGRNLLGLPTSVTVKTGTGAVVAQTTTAYDEPAYQLGNTYGPVTGWADPGGLRGNPTTVSSWLDTAGAYVRTHARYDQCGSVVGSWDANGKLTETAYSSTYAYAYPTSVTTPAPDPNNTGFGSTQGLVTTTAYDFSTGLVTSTTDANGQTTTFNYSDPFNRLKRVDLPDGGRTIYNRVDSHQCGAYVETRTLLDASGREAVSRQFFDGLGRPYLSETREDQDPNNPFVRVDTRYDPEGRVSQVSNPYRTSGCTAPANPSGHWTTTEYDALGRVRSVTTPDGAKVYTLYDGARTMVTDQVGKQRISKADALGRLADVWEVRSPDAATGTESVSFPIPQELASAIPAVSAGYRTSYAYDILGNLRKVAQGGQLRFFMYDSLGRLVRAKNPEQGNFTPDNDSPPEISFPPFTDPITLNTQWSVGYSYDANGNLLARKDARNVKTRYTYDALNRNTTARYSDGTRDVDRHYDGAVNGRGRLHYFNWDANNNARFDTHLAVDEYDPMGRPLKYRQHFFAGGSPSPQFLVTRTYDKAGNVLSQTYPSGRTVNYGYDIAGRVNSFSGNLGDGVGRTYAAGVTYSAFGGVEQEQFGTQTPLYHKLHYNVRGQLSDMRLSTFSLQANKWDWNRGAINFFYDSAFTWVGSPGSTGSGPDNNGNLTRAQTFVPLNEQLTAFSAHRDTYEYDALNRLKKVTEAHFTDYSGQTTPVLAQDYDYDRWGNRTVNAAQTWGAPEPQFELSPQTNQEVPEPSNRLYAPGDAGRPPAQKLMRYDAAGNLVYDSYTGNGPRVYDAEGKMTAAYDNTGNWAYYAYDADGKRVKRNIRGEEWWQVNGPGGELLAEYRAGAAPYVPTKEYGYRGGELLVTMSSGDDQRLRRFVTYLYYGALQRDPTAQELQEKVNQLASAGAQGQAQLQATAAQIARALFTSTNYETSPYRSDRQYVTDLYYAYLQRAPDDGGLDWWAGQVAAWGREHACNAFEGSAEFQAVVSTLYGSAPSDNDRTETFVHRFYLGAYGRAATSTELQQQRDALNAAGAQGQSQLQAQAEAMGRSLFASQVNDYSITDQQFVTNLYEGFLQRGPDTGGLNFWTSNAAGGPQNRQNVLNDFATSPAFRELSGTLYRETFWQVSDHLGTPRMLVGRTGNLAGVRRHDYLPFGDEVGSGVGGRTPDQGYGQSDGVRQKFTGYERDAETGLDFAESRYYSNQAGRFTGPDLPLADQAAARPQSWNLYAYTRNSPTVHIDPDGRRSTHTDENGRVLAVYDDGDLGVYKHSNEEISRWDGKSVLPSKGRGVVRMGETEYWDEFRAHDDRTGEILPDVAQGAIIFFATSFDADLAEIRAEAEYMSLIDIADLSRNGRRFDIKVNNRIAPCGPNTGRLLNGKYATARSAGNFLAGMNGAVGSLPDNYISETTMMKLAGALHQGKASKLNMIRIVLFGTEYGPAPWYGEIEYSGRRIQSGFRHGVHFRRTR